MAEPIHEPLEAVLAAVRGRRVVFVSAAAIAKTAAGQETGARLAAAAAAVETVAVTDSARGTDCAQLDQLAATLRPFGPQAIVCLGYGAVAETAKALALGLLYAGSLVDFARRRVVPFNALPWYLILTEGATGSECQGFVGLNDGKHRLRTGVTFAPLRPVGITLFSKVFADLQPAYDQGRLLTAAVLAETAFAPEASLACRGVARALLAATGEAAAMPTAASVAFFGQTSSIVGRLAELAPLPGRIRYLADLVLAKCPAASQAAAFVWAFETFLAKCPAEPLVRDIRAWLDTLPFAPFAVPPVLEANLSLKG